MKVNMTVLYVLLAILMLGILVMIHEGGHFMAARLMKIEVTEFAMGFGPKLFGWKSKKYDTVFSVRAIPFGGFCAFVGDESDPENTDNPKAFARQNIWKRMFTIFMGPAMNILLAVILSFGLYLFMQFPVGVDTFISEVNAGSPAAAAGLQSGDVISEINGVNMQDGTTETLTGTIASWKDGDEPLHLTVLRDGEEIFVDLNPAWDETENRMRLGIIIAARYREEKQNLPFGEAISAGWTLCREAAVAILTALRDLVTTGAGLDQTAGPVGVISLVTEQTMQGGLPVYIELMIYISINLGLMNLLPFPGLDGSRLVIGLIEAVRRKPIPQKVENTIYLCGMALLFLLLIFFTFKDVIGLFR